MPSRAQRERSDRRRALRLLADAPEGVTEARERQRSATAAAAAAASTSSKRASEAAAASTSSKRASASAASASTSPCELLAKVRIFFVKDIERAEADVRDFLLS
jgi:hypothetical protein